MKTKKGNSEGFNNKELLRLNINDPITSSFQVIFLCYIYKRLFFVIFLNFFFFYFY